MGNARAMQGRVCNGSGKNVKGTMPKRVKTQMMPGPSLTSLRSGILQRKCACGGTPGFTGECEECRKKRLQCKPQNSECGIQGDSIAPPIVHEVIRSPGQPLDPATRAFMEPRFGHDFSQVRVHTNANAAESARAVNALAYTVGRDVVFGAGNYAPITHAGRRLIAHELTHTIQQAGHGSSSPHVSQLEIGEVSSPAEHESDATADAVIKDSSFPGRRVQQTTPVAGLQRKVSPQLAHIQALLRKRGFFEKNISAVDTHQALLFFKAMSDDDLRDTVRALETQDKEYIERFLTHIGEDDQLHELETLRRIKNARVWKTETKTGGTTVTTEVVGSCSPDQFQRVYQAANTALGWLAAALARIDAYIAAPNNAASADVNNALTAHFHSTAADVVKHIRERLVRIRADIERAPQFSIECHGVWDRECADAGAYADPKAGLIVFCNSFFGNDAVYQAEAVVHEMAHAQVGGQHITDRAYQSNRLLRYLSTVEALTNAESYGLLVQQLGTGKVVNPTAPQDKPEDCPGDWWSLLQKAVAMAERWNRNLQVQLGSLTPNALKPPSKWGTYLGGATQGNINTAKKATDRVASKLESPVTFECEPGGGGRCDDGALTYWYFTGNLHVCPAWRAQAGEEARVRSLLAGLYGYIGDVDDNTRQSNYAQLAQENNAGWSLPTRGAVLGVSQGRPWSPDDINVSINPLQPKTSKYMYTESGKTHERLSNDLPTAPIPAPPPRTVEDNLRFEVWYSVDYGGQARPLPFTAPELRAEFHFVSPSQKIDRTQSDLRPVYQGEGQPLTTKLPTTWVFSINTSGSFQMRLELKDPDTNVTRVYDDKIQLQVTQPITP
jgi:Domain of unknown function (DUF4157)/Lysine-specific metallo-endopeptidase